MKAQTQSNNVGTSRKRTGTDETSVAVVVPRLEHAVPDRQIPDVNARRHAQIAQAAYYRAEKRGFAPGYEFEDWLAAEQEVEEKSRQI